jgi:hypothetical protein
MFYALVRLRVLPLLLLVALLLGAAATPVRADEPPNPNPTANWAAWGLVVSFPNGALRVKYAAYIGTNNPPGILDKVIENITADCAVVGDPLTIDANGYARFDGNSYIACDLPDWGALIAELAPHLRVATSTAVTTECEDDSPLWFSGDVLLDAVTGEQPLFDSLNLDIDLPSVRLSPATLKTRVRAGGRWAGNYNSAVWTTTNSTVNTFLSGEEGPISVAVINDFGGLPYLLNPGWQPYFNSNVVGSRMGLWREPAGSGSWVNILQSNFPMNTGPTTAYIGYDTGSGAYFQGSIKTLKIDPGCRAD